jgi:hypothetical protein
VIDTLKIASPCKANWNEMAGDDRMRFCGLCKLNVYNFSGMTRVEISDLLLRSEGRVCARMYQRKDGTLLTRDCPVGVRKRLVERWTAIAAGLAILVFGVIFGAQLERERIERKFIKVVTPKTQKADPLPDKHPVMMGEVAVPERHR